MKTLLLTPKQSKLIFEMAESNWHRMKWEIEKMRKEGKDTSEMERTQSNFGDYLWWFEKKDCAFYKTAGYVNKYFEPGYSEEWEIRTWFLNKYRSLFKWFESFDMSSDYNTRWYHYYSNRIDDLMDLEKRFCDAFGMSELNF